MPESSVDRKQINKDIFALIIPAVLENVLQVFAGFVTTALIGRLITDEIAAHGICWRVYQLCYMGFRGFSIGATVVTALYFGQKDLKRCKRLIEQSYLLTVPLSLLFAVIIILFPAQILGFFDDDSALVELAVPYARIIAWAIPFSTLISFNTSAFNGQSDTKTPMFIAVILNLVNVAACYILIFGIGGFVGAGINGAAMGTLLSQVVGALCGLILLYGRKGKFHGVERPAPFFSIDKRELRALCQAGIPAACENLFWQFSSIVLSKIILAYGANYFAAYQQAMQAEVLVEMPSQGFITASTTLTAKAIGMKNGKLVRGYFIQCRKMAFCVAAVAALILFFFPGPFMKILTDQTELITIGAHYVLIMSFSQIPQVLTKVYSGTVRAAGNKRAPMYITFVGIWCVRVPMSMLCAWVLQTEITFVWLAILFDQLVRFALSVIYLRRKKLLYVVEGDDAANG